MHPHSKPILLPVSPADSALSPGRTKINPSDAELNAGTSNLLSRARAAWRWLPGRERLRLGAFASYLVFLSLVFAQPLTRLTLYAARSNFYSYMLLVPFVSGYLFYMKRSRPSTAYTTSIAGAVAVGAIGFAALATGNVWHETLSINDAFSLLALAFLSFVVAGGFLFFGSKWMAAIAVPITFLIFIVPLPDAAMKWLEEASVAASAEAAALFFSASGTPVMRQGTVFELPGIAIRVAQECSGIHSSWVLFMSSLLTSNLFLKTRWRRIVLVAFVIPLGILRNGFRILVIGLLCVHIGPQMIDSSIHHRGGPLFFVLSLVPLLLLLLWLRRQEKRLKQRA